MTQRKNINIRIMFTPKNEIAEKEPNYVYHWHRIISVLLLLFALLATAVYVFYNPANQQNNMTQLAQIKTATPPLKMVKEPPTNSIQPTFTTDLSADELTVEQEPSVIQTNIKTNVSTNEPVVEETASVKQTNITTDQLTAEEAPSAIQTDNKTDVSTNEPVVEKTAITIQTDITADEPAVEETDITADQLTIEEAPIATQIDNKTDISTNKPTIGEVASEISADNKTTEENQLQPLFSQSTSTIFSEHIKTFVMAKAVINREPRGDLQEVTFDRNNIATVYVFCLAVGLVDKPLIYTWQLNGEHIAQVEVAVGSNHWRSYSRKFIQPSMHGKWRVILENKEGEILAVNEFSY